jgi:hypothetical protein
MSWLCGLVPYAQAEAILARIGKRAISASSLWRVVQQESQRLLEPLSTVPSATNQAAPVSALPETKMMSMDGGMVNIRGEGWKEVKVGVVGEVVGDEPLSSDIVPELQTSRLTYGAVLGDVAAFEPILLDLARATGFREAVRSCITADGAAWIWNLAQRNFPDSLQIVDWYHACQHLHLAAQTLFSDQAQRAQWLQERTADLFDGRLELLLSDLLQAGHPDLARFFQTHQARLRYAQFQDDGFPIGSGTVESAVKQFKARLTGPGMRWSRPGAQRMLALRAAVLDGSFDARWSLAA